MARAPQILSLAGGSGLQEDAKSRRCGQGRVTRAQHKMCLSLPADTWIRCGRRHISATPPSRVSPSPIALTPQSDVTLKGGGVTDAHPLSSLVGLMRRHALVDFGRLPTPVLGDPESRCSLGRAQGIVEAARPDKAVLRPCAKACSRSGCRAWWRATQQGASAAHRAFRGRGRPTRNNKRIVKQDSALRKIKHGHFFAASVRSEMMISGNPAF